MGYSTRGVSSQTSIYNNSPKQERTLRRSRRVEGFPFSGHTVVLTVPVTQPGNGASKVKRSMKRWRQTGLTREMRGRMSTSLPSRGWNRKDVSDRGGRRFEKGTRRYSERGRGSGGSPGSSVQWKSHFGRER